MPKIKTPKIKTEAVVFDQGNTLILDPFQTILSLKEERFGDLLQGHGVPLNGKELNEQWTKSNQRIHYPFIAHFFQEEPIIQDALGHLEVAPEVAAILALDLLREYRLGLKEVIASDPRTQEVRETLMELKRRGKRLGVFSNDRAAGLALTLAQMGIRGYFEYAETSEAIGIEKPDPRAFDHILDHFEVPPSRLTYVGDDPIGDIDAAKAKGIRAVLHAVDGRTYKQPWRDYDRVGATQPDAIIRHFRELLDVIA